MVDLCFAAHPRAQIERAVRDFRPEVIGISVRNIDSVDWQAPRFYLPQVKATVVDVCRELTDCPIVLGGPPAGIMPAEMIEFLGVDLLIRGDGEVAFVDLLGALAEGDRLDTVAGLAYRDAGGIHVSEPARAADLDALPMPHPHRWLDLPRYLSYNSSLGIQTKRGCGLKCSYCVYNEIEGPCYRLKSPQRVVAEVAEAIHEAGVTSIEFVDSTFNIPLPHALDVCRALIENDLQAKFSTMGINPGAVTEELFALLRRANFSEVSITPESASPGVLEGLGKNFTVEQIARAARTARKFRMPIVWYFMFGGPGESEATVRETLAFIDAHIPREHLVLMVSGIRIFEGAPLAARARDEGQIPRQGSLLEPVWYRPEIRPERLFAMLDEAILHHPNYIALQDNRVPQSLLRAAKAVHGFLGATRPLWYYLRYVNRLHAALGLSPRGPIRWRDTA